MLALHAAARTPRTEGRQHDDLVANLFDVAHLNADAFERLVHRAQGVLIGCSSLARAWLDRVGRIYVLDVGT
jgi:hypothetical protein